MKKLLGCAAALAVVASIVWIGGYVVWQLRITSALAAMESQAVPAPGTPMGYAVPPEVEAELKAAGDRALPFIVDRLDSRKSPVFLAAVGQVLYERRPIGSSAQEIRLQELRIQPGDPPDERARKCEEWRRLWKQDWAPWHRSWRWWSSSNFR